MGYQKKNEDIAVELIRDTDGETSNADIAGEFFESNDDYSPPHEAFRQAQEYMRGVL